MIGRLIVELGRVPVPLATDAARTRPDRNRACLPSFSWSHIEGCNSIAVVDA